MEEKKTYSITIYVLQMVVHIFCLLSGHLLYASVFLKFGKLTFSMCAHLKKKIALLVL